MLSKLLYICSCTEESHKDVFNACPTGPNLDISMFDYGMLPPFAKIM